jgi:isopenicillin N synthase-like dioxygenase
MMDREFVSVSLAKFSRGTPEERALEIAKTRAACTRLGAFFICDHGLTPEIYSDMVEQSSKFFQLPIEEKMKRNEPCGYPPFVDGRCASPDAHMYELKAKYTNDDGQDVIVREWLSIRSSVGFEFDETDPYFTCPEGKEFFSPVAKHPEQGVWPDGAPGLKSAGAAYYQHQVRIANVLYELFACALDLPANFFKERARRLPVWPLKVSHYVPQTHDIPTKDCIYKHYDRVFFTMLQHSKLVEGCRGAMTQVLIDPFADAEVWVDMRASNDEIFVMVGQMLMYWTNCFFRACVHRVTKNPLTNDALPEGSIGPLTFAGFVFPDYDTVVEPLPSCIWSTGGVCKFPTTHIGEMFNRDSNLPVYDKEKQKMLRELQGVNLVEANSMMVKTSR